MRRKVNMTIRWAIRCFTISRVKTEGKEKEAIPRWKFLLPNSLNQEQYNMQKLVFSLPLLVQEEKGGYRHPTREFTGIGDFGQFRGADSEFRCYTEN